MPVKAAGWRIDPPVSVPVAPGAMPAATAADEPPERREQSAVRDRVEAAGYVRSEVDAHAWAAPARGIPVGLTLSPGRTCSC